MREHTFTSPRALPAFCALLFSLLVATHAPAQTGTSSVRGAIVDAQGDSVAGATVTLTSTETNAARTQTTSDDGAYAFELIPPGGYRLEAEAGGFKKALVADVRALVAKPIDINVQLEAGDVAETVTITAGASEALLNTQDATLGNNFDTRQIVELPLEARNVAALLTLQPGVTRTGYVAGARSDQSNVTLDGVDINEAQTNQIGAPGLSDTPGDVQSRTVSPASNTVLRLNSEAIEEFRVTTANANAQAGRSSGAQISLVTKSGTNDFRGAAFWFHRPTILTANDFFNNRNGVERPSLIRNTFSGAIGGPIVRDRAFFFYNYEGRRDRSQVSVVRQVPLASLGRGELRYGNPSGGVTTLTSADIAAIFPSLGGTNPAALALLADAARKYPANDLSVGDSRPGRLLNSAGYRFNAPLPVDLNSHAARFDLNLTDDQTAFVRANVIHDLIGGVPAFPDTPSPDTWSHPWGIAAGHTWTINNRFVNNFRYGITREAFTSQGDAAQNAIFFFTVFSPLLNTRTISRETPVQNFTDDLSYVRGNHTAQFGTNIRLIRNRRTSFANAYDTAYTNPSGYFAGGVPLSNAINAYSPIGAGQISTVQNNVAAILGRLTTYDARFTFDIDGNLLPSGSPSVREFATEEYDFYAQDVWKIRPNLTLTYGLRYGLSRPVYETQGYEAKPTIALSEYFRRRLEAAARGQNYNEPLAVDLSGPANGRTPMYRWDKNNFQPRVAVAWSPNFRDGVLGRFFGRESQSVIRGGFGITNDYIGQSLAVSFDLNNTLGFSSASSIAPGTFNTTTRPGPLLTGLTQDVRGLPFITTPGALTFPQQKPRNRFARLIEASLDEELVSPISYSWNATFERQLPKGLLVQASYLGRAGRNLLASRDVMMANNLVDPVSGVDWYTAAGQLEDLRRAGTPISAVPTIPYFENLFGSVPGFLENYADYSGDIVRANVTQAVYASALLFWGNDWTTPQDQIDYSLPSPIFFQTPYYALSSWGTIANSDYHAGALSVRQRLGEGFTADFNYTFSKSLDDASGLQNAGLFGGGFIRNPIRQRDSYAASDFDIRHIINVNSVWQIPVGRGRAFLSDINPAVDAFLGGWQLSGIFRYNSGAPVSAPFDASQWATNWQVQSFATRTRPLQSCPTRGSDGAAPNLFGCDRLYAYQSFRSAKPGESGERNVFRLPGYVALDMGLAKSFAMPWSEQQRLQLRFEAFNVTNTQRFGAIAGGRTGYGVVLDPQNATPTSDWMNFIGIQGDRRVMQFGFRYSF